ncbi:MAG: Bifunctional NAD(P)H-hydrate repair enzyme [Gemmatimonadetes bacterium]|nr:Bifunctional NAD(P)H-hydrate repair enzyme [Gemmatimonadota bacterium]
MRAWDDAAIRDRGIPQRVLMETAGRGVAAVVQRLYPHGRVAAAAGSGNNGGDAMVALRVLASWGREVVAVQAGSSPPDAALLHGWMVDVRPADDAADAFRGAGVILDGVLGTGSTGAPRGASAGVIGAMNAAGLPIVALDGPSGIDLTTGAAAGIAVRAEVTVTFGAPKRGLLLFPGREHAGRILAAEIGFHPADAGSDTARLITPAWARAHLPAVSPGAHKGTLGLVSVVAGRSGMAGAAVLCGWGALRAGAGKVRVSSDAENRAIVQTALPEALFADRSAGGAAEALADSQAVVAGAGMGTSGEDLAFLRAVVGHGDSPLLLDADAVTLLARNPGLRDAIHRPLLLTPHPGEMARLLSIDTKGVVADPFAAAEQAAERFRCAVLLKGAGVSLVAQAGQPTLVNVAGHAGVATGGMGDVLGGVAGALMAAGAPPREAAALALFYAGRAAQIAGRGRGLLPRDVAEALPFAMMDDGSADGEPLLPGIVLDLHAAY